jgi:protein-tyrosine phosphatase
MSKETWTSDTHPIRADFLPDETLGLPGKLGMTFAPGMKDFAWDRDAPKDLRLLSEEYGADVLVSLMEDFEYDKYEMGGMRGFFESAKDAGLEVRHFPILDVDVPRPEQDEEYAAYIGDIIAALEAGKTVVAHCRGGIGRTGTVAASVLVGVGHDPDEAISIVRRTRSPRMLEVEWQEEYVREFAKENRGRWKG